MASWIDISLIVLILVCYGLGDLLTTIWGIYYYDLLEGNKHVVRLVGENPSTLQSLGVKILTTSLAMAMFFIGNWETPFFVADIPLTLLAWRIAAVAVTLRGIQVTLHNFNDIQRARHEMTKPSDF